MLLCIHDTYTAEQIKRWVASGYTFEPHGDGFKLSGWNEKTLDELIRPLSAAHSARTYPDPITVNQLIDQLTALRDAGKGDSTITLADDEGEYKASRCIATDEGVAIH